MTTSSDTRPEEAELFFAALRDFSPNALTACSEWTAHDLGAHVAATYEEAARHVRAYAEGEPLTSTRGFEEREAPFKRLGHSELLAEIERGEQRMRSEIGGVLAQRPDATLRWTGRDMRVDAFLSHLRSECALHRWDLCGDDDVSARLLGQYDLLKHAVTAIGAGPLCARGAAAGVEPFSARVRSDGQPDLLVEVRADTPSLTLAEPEGEAVISGDAAARLLLLWGRNPRPAGRLLATGAAGDLPRVRGLLAGY
jgi:hypothetical protein